ncbi:MAG: hypothetical protein IJP31_11635 [Lachnospiraceae bacterium]|nr:hypothetical protein [Lachnospiraceae bacterium]
MALSESTIIFNFQKAKRQADELDQIASNISKMASSEFGETMQNIARNWKGEKANAYLAKGSILQEDMKSTAGFLHKIAAEIREIAQRIYEAEMRALAIAQERNYS